MKCTKSFGLAVIGLALQLTACKNDKASSTDAAATHLLPLHLLMLQILLQHKLLRQLHRHHPGPTTTVEFETMVHDWGEIKEAITWNMPSNLKHRKRASGHSDAKGSCGCTVPDWPRAYRTRSFWRDQSWVWLKGVKDRRWFKANKKLLLQANTNPTQSYLTITGVVKKTPGAALTLQKK